MQIETLVNLYEGVGYYNPTPSFLFIGQISINKLWSFLKNNRDYGEKGDFVMSDISEQLFQAIDIITAKRIEALAFDKTIVAEIIGNDKAHKGEYIVTDGATTFLAYSEDVTMKLGTSVYVTIPNGDFTKQKLITGKHVSEDSEYYTYVSPLDKYVDITGDICVENSVTALVANSTKISEKVIWSSQIPYAKDFERIGLKADFKSWLKTFGTNLGNYGLRIDVTTELPTTTTTKENRKYYSYYLDSDDMYGNPYNYETYYTQEAVFDISEIEGQIKFMRVVFYQKQNFVDKNGVLIPHLNEDGEELFSNIFVKNIHIGLGYDIEKFKNDSVILYTFDGETYNNEQPVEANHKELQIRWIHFGNNGIYSIDNVDEIPDTAQIHWYKYKIGFQETVDELAGPFWEEIPDTRNQLKIEVDPDTSELTQQYKVVVELPSLDSIEATLQEASDGKYQELLDAVDKAESDYKNALENDDEFALKDIWEKAQFDLNDYVAGVRGMHQAYTSNILKLTSEVPVVDKLTADLINGLKIIVDESGYKGNYLLYSQSSEIQNPNEATKMRTMKATYQSITTGDPGLDGAEYIIWKIPLLNTMIYAPEEGKEFDTTDGVTSTWDEGGYRYIKRMSGNKGSNGGIGTVTNWSVEQKFRIKDYYMESSTNNIVYCIVMKNNIGYQASYQMVFGPMGSNGTDFTFRMNFDSDTPGVTAGNSSPIKIYISLYDYNNERVPLFYQKGVKVTWYSKDTTQKIIFCDAEGNKLANQDEITITTKEENDDYPSFYIKYIGDTLEDKVPLYYILQAKLNANPTAGGGVTELGTVMLDCYLPVPYRSDPKYTGIEGGTRIVYKSDGSRPSYYDEPFTLWCGGEKQTNALWVCANPETLAGTANKYYPFFKSAASGKFIVPSIYVHGLSKQINVTARIDDVIVWSNPVIMYCDAYTSALLNSWDGNLTIDEKNGTILSTMIGAGKKELDNSFSGVMMGDVTCAVDATMKLGLYGFNHGLQSFGFTIDGKGFIGKAGQGQILFDGNRGTISSGAWRNSGGTVGMEIDLDGPTPANGDNWESTGSTLKARGYAGSFELDTSITSNGRGNLLRIKDGDDNTLMMISTQTTEDGDNVTSKYYLQSSVYDPGSEGTRLDLQNGKLTTYGPAGYVIIDSSDNNLFRIATSDGTHLMNVGVNAYWLRSYDYATSGGTEGTCLNLTNGCFVSNGSGGYITMRSNSSNMLIIQDSSKNTLMNVGSSSYYLQSSNYATSQIGLYINLANGDITSKNGGGTILINPSNANGLFVIKDSGSKVLMNVGSGSYFLQSSNYDASAGFKLDLANGNITGHNFHIYLTKDGNYLSIGGAGKEFAIDVNGMFQVGWDGNTYLRKSAKLTVESGQILSGPNDAPGKYYEFNSNGGVIGGWKITENTIESEMGNVILTSTAQEGTIEIRGETSGRNYFKMGTKFAHPEVSGLNVTQPESGGISFRSVVSGGTQYGSIYYSFGQKSMILGGAPWQIGFSGTPQSLTVYGPIYSYSGDIYVENAVTFGEKGSQKRLGYNTVSNLMTFSDGALAAHNDGGIASKNWVREIVGPLESWIAEFEWPDFGGGDSKS